MYESSQTYTTSKALLLSSSINSFGRLRTNHQSIYYIYQYQVSLCQSPTPLIARDKVLPQSRVALLSPQIGLPSPALLARSKKWGYLAFGRSLFNAGESKVKEVHSSLTFWGAQNPISRFQCY